MATADITIFVGPTYYVELTRNDCLIVASGRYGRCGTHAMLQYSLVTDFRRQSCQRFMCSDPTRLGGTDVSLN